MAITLRIHGVILATRQATQQQRKKQGFEAQADIDITPTFIIN